MFHLLSDSEVVLNELLVACRESIDHYEDAINLSENPVITDSFRKIAAARKPFINKLEEEIRQLGDLPSVPDPDKETSEMIMHHVGAAFTPDYTHELLAQRIEAEENIKSIIAQAHATQPSETCVNLLNELRAHVEQTIALFVAATKEIN